MDVQGLYQMSGAATPRSKYHKYTTASNVVSNNANNGGGSIDTSNFVVKTGETEQTVEGSFGAMQDIVAFKTSYSYFDSYLPIASSYAPNFVTAVTQPAFNASEITFGDPPSHLDGIANILALAYSSRRIFLSDTNPTNTILSSR